MEDTEKIISGFISKEKDSLNPKELCDIEKLLWLFNAIEPAGNAEDAWAILVGYNSPVISCKAEKEYGKELYNIRRMFPKLSYKKRWQEYLQEYKKLDKKVRLYEINDLGKIQENKPQICCNRAKDYSEALINYKSIKAKDIKRAGPGIFYYERKRRDIINYRWKEEVIEKFSGSIPKSLVKLNPNLLPPYREKKELYLQEDYNWENFMESMPAKGWTKRPVIELQHYLKGEKRRLDYKNSIHIIGGLGAGKSNYKLAETYRLVTKCGAKVGIVESDVTNVLETKRRLRELGLNVAVIIGRTNEGKHLDKYIRVLNVKL